MAVDKLSQSSREMIQKLNPIIRGQANCLELPTTRENLKN